MANRRKTQGEIDRLLKKISEGMDVYEETPPRHAELWEQAWSRTEVAFTDIQAACDARGIRLITVIFPCEAETSWPTDMGHPTRRITKILKGLDIEYVDLTPDFRAHPDPDALFVRLDGHWSAVGHEVAAAGVLRYLAAHPTAPESR